MLSHSKYGKYGNPNYTGPNKEIYQNKADYITGMSNGTPSTTVIKPQVTYDIPDTGYGASTTGTIYGVYDMSGGASEYVMGNHNSVSGQNASLNSGFCGTNGPTSGCIEWPEEKYLNLYTIGTSYLGYKQGDATYETEEWYDDNSFFLNPIYPFFLRGGRYNNDTGAGIFFHGGNNGSALTHLGMRLALKP